VPANGLKFEITNYIWFCPNFTQIWVQTNPALFREYIFIKQGHIKLITSHSSK